MGRTWLSPSEVIEQVLTEALRDVSPVWAAVKHWFMLKTTWGVFFSDLQNLHFYERSPGTGILGRLPKHRGCSQSVMLPWRRGGLLA